MGCAGRKIATHVPIDEREVNSHLGRWEIGIIVPEDKNNLPLQKQNCYSIAGYMSKDNKNFYVKKNPWSEVKDRLLGCYLPQYFQKILTTKKPVFYVDCFAGKGRFDDGKDGSPRVALAIRDECLARTKVTNGTIDSCFIELNYADDLQNNIADFSNLGNIDIISGKYEDNIGRVLAGKQNTNVFLYIDPYGIKELDSVFLMNFLAQNMGLIASNF